MSKLRIFDTQKPLAPRLSFPPELILVQMGAGMTRVSHVAKLTLMGPLPIAEEKYCVQYAVHFPPYFHALFY